MRGNWGADTFPCVCRAYIEALAFVRSHIGEFRVSRVRQRRQPNEIESYVYVLFLCCCWFAGSFLWNLFFLKPVFGCRRERAPDTRVWHRAHGTGRAKKTPHTTESTHVLRRNPYAHETHAQNLCIRTRYGEQVHAVCVYVYSGGFTDFPRDDFRFRIRIRTHRRMR